MYALPAPATLATVVAVASGVAATTAPPRTERVQSTRVTVLAGAGSEFSFTLSRDVVDRGTVVFQVVDRGTLSHDFEIAGKKTPLLRPGGRARLVVRLRRAGRYRYRCTVPGHAAAGMTGVLLVR